MRRYTTYAMSVGFVLTAITASPVAALTAEDKAIIDGCAQRFIDSAATQAQEKGREPPPARQTMAYFPFSTGGSLDAHDYCGGQFALRNVAAPLMQRPLVPAQSIPACEGCKLEVGIACHETIDPEADLAGRTVILIPNARDATPPFRETLLAVLDPIDMTVVNEIPKYGWSTAVLQNEVDCVAALYSPDALGQRIVNE